MSIFRSFVYMHTRYQSVSLKGKTEHMCLLQLPAMSGVFGPWNRSQISSCHVLLTKQRELEWNILYINGCECVCVWCVCIYIYIVQCS